MNNNSNISVVVDAGHGGNDPGAVNGTLREKDFNLRVAEYIYNRLQDLGINSALTRDSDTTLNATDRVNKALSFFGNSPNIILVSNHMNSGGVNSQNVTHLYKKLNKIGNIMNNN